MSGTTPEMTGQNQGAGSAWTGYRTVTSVTEVTVVFFVSVHSRRVLKPTRRGPKKLRQLPAAEPDPGAEKAASKIQKKCLAASNIYTGARQGGCGGCGGIAGVGFGFRVRVCRVSLVLCWVCTWGWQDAGAIGSSFPWLCIKTTGGVLTFTTAQAKTGRPGTREHRGPGPSGHGAGLPELSRELEHTPLLWTLYTGQDGTGTVRVAAVHGAWWIRLRADGGQFRSCFVH